MGKGTGGLRGRPQGPGESSLASVLATDASSESAPRRGLVRGRHRCIVEILSPGAIALAPQRWAEALAPSKPGRGWRLGRRKRAGRSSSRTARMAARLRQGLTRKSLHESRAPPSGAGRSGRPGSRRPTDRRTAGRVSEAGALCPDSPCTLHPWPQGSPRLMTSDSNPPSCPTPRYPVPRTLPVPGHKPTDLIVPCRASHGASRS